MKLAIYKRHFILVLALFMAASALFVSAVPASAFQEGVGCSPAVLTYGNVTRLSSHTQQLTVYNLGSAPANFTITSNSSAIKFSPAKGKLGPGSSVVVNVTLNVPQGSTLGAHSAVITVTMSYGTNMNVAVSTTATWNVVHGYFK
jgi:hypothetical protein